MCITTSKEVQLRWDNALSARTVPLTETTNVATFHLAPGYKNFKAFCVEVGVDNTQEELDPITALEAGMVSDDEDDDDLNHTPPMEDTATLPHTDWGSSTTPKQTSFDLDGPSIPRTNQPTIITDEEDRQPDTDTGQLLQYHQRFGHISFGKLQIMAKIGILPRNLSKCNIPVCTACQYAKATKRPWRTKPMKEDQIPPRLAPGDLVSVDQLTSQTPGFIAQMTGVLLKQRYRYTLVFVDQSSRLGFVYLQKTATADETIQAKQAFELYAL